MILCIFLRNFIFVENTKYPYGQKPQAGLNITGENIIIHERQAPAKSL